MAIELYVRACLLSRTAAILAAKHAGAREAPPLTSSSVPLDDASIERLLRVVDLAAQRSGLRFRRARVALNDARDDLLAPGRHGRDRRPGGGMSMSAEGRVPGAE
jgi:hypothetical protein